MDSINKIFKVIKHMNTHLEDKLSLDDLCVVSGYTKSHLCYLFKFYIGETPNKYFYQQKLKYAADILTGDEKVLDIAVKIGFESHEAFTRAFKKEFGITPVEYRELYNKVIGCCGSDCFKCDTLRASIEDDDDLRKEIAEHSKTQLPYELNYTEVNCLGCKSDDVSENCISHCPWKPCCKNHGVNRCNQCEKYPCSNLVEMFNHLPEFKENFSNIDN